MMNVLKIASVLFMTVKILSFRLQPNSQKQFTFLEQHQSSIKQVANVVLTSSLLVSVFSNNVLVSRAEDTAIVTSSSSTSIPVVPLYKNKGTDLIKYADVARGFSLLRPFGFNEFDGAGGGYAVKFSSIIDIDENVIVGTAPASADKKSITDFGSLEALGTKLATKRGGKLIASSARETDGIVYYQFEFENPLDPNLPRTGPKDKRPTTGVELYELCVSKGKLWSVQATSNSRNFPSAEKKLRNSLASFSPRL